MQTSEPLSIEEVGILEAKVDEIFAGAELPTPDQNNSRRAVLRASEDQLRFALQRAAKDSLKSHSYRQAVSGFIVLVDAYKYQLRAALNAIDTRQPYATSKIIHDGETGEFYTKAGSFVFLASAAYTAAARVFGPVHNGTRTLSRTADGSLQLSDDPAEYGYAALEALHGADDVSFSPIPFLVNLVAHRSPWPEALIKLIGKTSVHRERVRYQFITTLGRELLKIFSQDKPDIPTGWTFPCGDLALVSAVHQGLSTRAFYHLMAITYGAERRHLVGLGVDQICLEVSRQTLIQDLARVLDRSVNEIAPVVDFLTYGTNTTHPDPALQPLIPVDHTKLILAPFLILTSNWPRNILSLHARVDPRSFNSQSHSFEYEMITRLEIIMRSDWPHWSNKNLPIAPGFEEIDLIVADPKSGTLLLCEARWMIQPGDVREVLQRKKALREKVQQAERKRDSVRANLPAVIATLNLDASINWSVQAIVLIDNFGGAPSSKADIPIVHRKVFAHAVPTAPTLELLHSVLSTDSWLPRNGADYQRVYEEFDLGGMKIEMPGFQMGKTSYMHKNLPNYLRTAYNTST
ncbi:hypothetical protein [Brevundimonas nasdae]|uniref:hypothetical protein n=1 Tax=Brevundimonas nasdae TaxID=172043 RepID=UPI003F690AB5